MGKNMKYLGLSQYRSKRKRTPDSYESSAEWTQQKIQKW